MNCLPDNRSNGLKNIEKELLLHIICEYCTDNNLKLKKIKKYQGNYRR